jgi:predicted signal transduction protein with EAL and GGDEF domain
VINDSLGHGAGDAALAAVADRLRDVVRPEDTVARFGGDEFVVCCRAVTDEAHAIQLAERVRARLSDPIEIRGELVHVGASVGIALGGADGDPDELLRGADAAMYRAKQNGGGYAVASGEDASRALERLRDENTVRHALARGELTVHYQPIMDMQKRRPVALEALLRWRHPVEGLIGPAAFIRVAEETGEIVPIGEWVIREACAAGKRFRAADTGHEGLVINVNVSARQLGAGDLVGVVRHALQDTATPPHLLCLELTETELVEDVPAYADVLGRLERLGVRLAIDDFGAGYSSLRYLSSLPIQTVKVDRAFVSGTAAAEGGAPILRAAVSMAEAFELDAIAEGVEAPDQEKALLQMGYRFAQGFHFARPLPEEDAAALLESYGPEKPIRGSFDASLT